MRTIKLSVTDKQAKAMTDEVRAGRFRDVSELLRMPNNTLDGRTPLACLSAGRWQAMADKVDDMLTGAPS